MIQNTLMVFGPGGIGKSPLDDLIRQDVLRIDPYRLRKRPRDQAENSGSPDMFYAHRNLRRELPCIFEALGDAKEGLSDQPVVEWYPKSRTTFFDVRDEWQCLLLGSLDAQYAKAEIFGPAVPALFRRGDVRGIFGDLSIIVLNPVAPLRELDGDYSSLKAATEDNCRKAGRSEDDITKRLNSIDDQKAPEAAAWLAMLELGGIEFSRWPFPEHRYKTDRIGTLLEARRTLVERSSALERFLKREDEIHGSAKTGQEKPMSVFTAKYALSGPVWGREKTGAELLSHLIEVAFHLDSVKKYEDRIAKAKAKGESDKLPKLEKKLRDHQDELKKEAPDALVLLKHFVLAFGGGEGPIDERHRLF